MANQTIIDYKQCFGTEHGKRTLEHLKKLTRFNVAVVPRGLDGHIDPYEVVGNERMRSVIIHIETMLRQDPNREKGISNEPE